MYSPIGLKLSWEGGENIYKQIKKRLHQLTAKLITMLQNELKNKVFNCDYISQLTLKPNQLTLHLPSKINKDFMINPYLINYIKIIKPTKYYLWSAGYCIHTNEHINNNIFFTI